MNSKKFHHKNIKGWKGFGQAELETTAFESAKISGIISEYDIELIQIISKIYKRQDVYSGFGNTILDKMININSSTKVIDALGMVQIMTTDLLGLENYLLVEIEKIETEIKTPHNSVNN